MSYELDKTKTQKYDIKTLKHLNTKNFTHHSSKHNLLITQTLSFFVNFFFCFILIEPVYKIYFIQKFNFTLKMKN